MSSNTFKKIRKQLILGLTELGYDLQNYFVTPIDYIQILLQENESVYDRINLKAGILNFETNVQFDCQKALNEILNEFNYPIYIGFNHFTKKAFGANNLNEFLDLVEKEFQKIAFDQESYKACLENSFQQN